MCLTCPVEQPNGHGKLNIWVSFMSQILKVIGETNTECYYMLFGKYAQNCKKYIKVKKDKILNSSHPSPLSAHKGFFGLGHFKTVNKTLNPPIIW